MKTGANSVRAFSLLEVMIAVGILTVVVGAIYSTWTAIIRATKTIKTVAAESHRERIAIQVLEDALSAAQLYEANADWYAFVAENGPQPLLSFVACLPESFPRAGRFGDLRMRRVIFSVERGPEGDNRLVLRQVPLLMEIDRDEDEFPLVLARNVREFFFTFWDAEQGKWLDEWKATNKLPQIVLVSLSVGQETTVSATRRRPARQLVRIVNIPCRGVPTVAQSRPVGPGPLRQPGQLQPPAAPGAQPQPGSVPQIVIPVPTGP